jgi:hypothetical protein
VIHPIDSPSPHSSSAPYGFSPAQIRHAYGFDQIAFNHGTVQGDGSGQTIAVVDAYDDPNIAWDLHAFDVQFGLPDPAFIKVAQDGSTRFPSTDPAGSGNPNWESETALDVEWAHAIAPGATILLVEAYDPSNLFTAVDFAARQPGVVVVSMSWGSNEYASETALDRHFTTPAGHAGITFVASAGDQAIVNYPAASPHVLAVGGTSLRLDGEGNIASETAWSSSGGGVSQYEPSPSYQSGTVSAGPMRATPDVAYDADPWTGFSIYDSYNDPQNPWFEFGGTSAGAPQWAALIAIADQGRALRGLGSLDGPSQTLPLLYALRGSDFRDITSGGGQAGSGGAGYDLITGLGSPLAYRLVADLALQPVGGAWALTQKGNVQSIAATTQAGGLTHVFVIGQDGQVWTETSTPGGAWTPWQLTQSGKVLALSVVTDSLGQQHVFAIGLDNQVWSETSLSGGRWTPWQLTQPGRVLQLAATLDSAGQAHVFAIGLDSQVWTETVGSTGRWNPWTLTQPGQVCALSVVEGADGRPHVFVIGLDGQVWAEAAGPSGQWSPWTLTQPGRVQGLSAVLDANGQQHVLALGLDGEVWAEAANLSGQWGPWILVQPGRVKAVAAALDSAGNARALVIGLDDQIWD